jgi:hypothetical protein
MSEMVYVISGCDEEAKERRGQPYIKMKMLHDLLLWLDAPK